MTPGEAQQDRRGGRFPRCEWQNSHPSTPPAADSYGKIRLMTRLLGLILLVSLTLAMRAPAAAADPVASLERDLVALTNVDRTSNGLNALIEDDSLVGVSRERSQDMLDRDYFSHEIPPNGEKVFAVLDR